MDNRVASTTLAMKEWKNAGSTGSSIDVRTINRSASLFQCINKVRFFFFFAGAHHNVKSVRHIYLESAQDRENLIISENVKIHVLYLGVLNIPYLKDFLKR
jgi:hypothetical protein